jgi:hypothetical protein
MVMEAYNHWEIHSIFYFLNCPLPCLIAGGKGWEVVTTCVGKLERFQLVGFTGACTHINVHIYIIYIISGQIGIVHESE